mmetsp:Transcript_11040/g.40444  ORF Transcript_11040/g.40444 Transcript_11040/m.40444 type:complete len:112 (-) Transcript_11040:1339-1674(-)|eukprot:scaffold1061_cov213-Prasinococcus_capsulatus_cf.AAC.12
MGATDTSESTKGRYYRTRPPLSDHASSKCDFIVRVLQMDSPHMGAPAQGPLQVQGAAYELQNLVDQDHRRGERDHKQPFVQAQWHDTEHARQDWHVKNEEVQPEGQCHGVQ